MSNFETLNYVINYNGHPVSCIEVGSIPITGYTSLEDAMNNKNGIMIPNMVFNVVDDILDNGVIPTTIWVNMKRDFIEDYDWEEETVLSTGDILGIQQAETVQKQYVNRKQRRAARFDSKKAHRGSDRAHGKRHGDKYLNSLPRKKYLEADNYDHPTFRVEKGKLRPIHDVKRARETARVRDAMDVSEIERLTASVLAEVKQFHGMVGCTWNVFYLSEAICRREQLPYPDYAYVRERDNKIELILEYEEYEYDESYFTYEFFDLLHI